MPIQNKVYLFQQRLVHNMYAIIPQKSITTYFGRIISKSINNYANFKYIK